MLTVKLEIEDFFGVIVTVDAQVGYLGVYKVTREYGGPEEGGWWYDHRHHILSIPMLDPGNEREVKEIEMFLTPRFRSSGRLDSARGGVKYEFRPEAEEGQYKTTRKPSYE